ncbi:MAG TPA: hypothetical protein VG675_14415 [Bryobacteraceae bacterium]|nr:hypothetical protein [Bryobacteraceae bacterium]
MSTRTRILLACLLLAGTAGAQNAASVKIALAASGSASTAVDPILFQVPGTITPFGGALITVALWVTPATYTSQHGFAVEIDVDNIGVGGKFINGQAPVFKSFGTGTLSRTGDTSVIAVGTVSIDEGTEQFSLPTGSMQFTVSYALNPAAEVAQVTLDAEGTVTSDALQEIINQQQLAPSVKKLFTTINPKSTAPAKKMSIGLWNGTQNIIWTAASSTDSGGNWLQASPSSGTAAPASTTNLTATANARGLSPGVYQGGVTVSGNASPPVQGQSVAEKVQGQSENQDQAGSFSFTLPVTMVVTSGDQLVLSQTGVQLQSVAGSAPLAQTVAVSTTGSSPLSFSTAVSTLSGGNWLSVAPHSGSTSTSGPATPVQINADITGLAPGVYFGRVDFAAPSATNSPQSLEVALNVLASAASPIVEPTALEFVAAAGSTPAPQTLLVIDPSAAAVTINPLPIFDQGQSWFSVTPAPVTLTPGQPLTLTVTPHIAGLTAGVYLGSISLEVGNVDTAYTLPVEMVVTPGDSGASIPQAACTPTQLLPVVTSLFDGFTTQAGLPVPLQVQVVDSCGNPLNDGSVVASTGPADPSVSLTPVGNGQWAGTWLPHEAAGGAASVAVSASSFTPDLHGSVSIAGKVSANSTAPLVVTGSVVNPASWTANAPVAPGGFLSIFGSNLATGSSSAAVLPFLPQMGGTRVLMGNEPLPLQYTGSGQINALVPYDVPVNSTQQLVVERNGVSYSLPETVLVSAAQPAVFTQDQSGKGAGAIVVVKADGTQFLNTSATPAGSGDALEIFCTGLGAVTPAVPAGSAAPASPPATTVNAVSVQIGGQTVTPFFAGLAPGFAGLYQVNILVPTGIPAAVDVPLVLSVAGVHSPPVTVAVH